MSWIRRMRIWKRSKRFHNKPGLCGVMKIKRDHVNVFCSDSTTKIEGKGENGSGEVEKDDIRNQNLENMKEDGKETKKEKSLATNIIDVDVQQTLPS